MSTEGRNSVRGEDDKFDDDKKFEILVVDGRKLTNSIISYFKFVVYGDAIN